MDLLRFAGRNTGQIPPPLLQNCDFQVGPVGGADEAVGHLLKLVAGSFLASAELARAFVGDVAEDAAERAETVPTGLEGDLGDRQVGVAEQRLGALDAAGEEVAMRRHPESIFE
jgi:hypothetical protein